MMLGLGGCPRLCSLHNTTSSLLSQSKTLQSYQTYQPLLPFLSVNASSTASFLPSIHRLREPQLGFRVVLGRERIGFCVSARKRRNGDGTPLDEDGIGDDGDESDDEDAFIAFPDMMRWYNNKPSGFGEGKVYDTRIEDKLLEEIKQSRVAQLANIDKLKKNPVNPNSEKANNQGQKAPEPVANAFRVRVANLPKKKNIHRDLQLAFKGVPGIVNIIPAVSGNKKTRDPVCKGFAFVDLKTENDVNRFVHMFSEQNITFGKIRKQIKCEITNSGSPNVTYEQSAVSTFTDPQSTVPSFDETPASDFDIDNFSLDVWEETASEKSDGPDDLEGDMASDFDMDITSLDTWQETASDESNALDDEQKITVEREDVRENLESFSISEMDGDDRLEPSIESASDSLSSKQLEEIWALENKPLGKQGEKVLKLKVQASELNDGDITDQRVGAAVDSSSSKPLENIQALERRLLARGKGWKVSKLNIHAAGQNFGDSMDPRQQPIADSLPSKQLESIQELERRPLARGKWGMVPKSKIPTSELNGDDRRETRDEPTTNSVSSKQQKKKKKPEKKQIAQKNQEKAPVLKLPGSANRLRIKEKVVLTDVFSKYGVKAANTTKQQG